MNCDPFFLQTKIAETIPTFVIPKLHAKTLKLKPIKKMAGLDINANVKKDGWELDLFVSNNPKFPKRNAN